jgi:hypothetical protein
MLTSGVYQTPINNNVKENKYMNELELGLLIEKMLWVLFAWRLLIFAISVDIIELCRGKARVVP